MMKKFTIMMVYKGEKWENDYATRIYLGLYAAIYILITLVLSWT